MILAWVRDALGPCPAGWQQVAAPMYGQFAFQNWKAQLQVIYSGDVIAHERWLHVSVVKRTGMPTYDDMVVVKQAFLGDRLAVQVFVPKAEHVNIHERCLHLWCNLDRRVTPDFTGGTGSI